MELLTNDTSLDSDEDTNDDSLPCFLQYVAKMLVVSETRYSGATFGVSYWRLGRSAKIGLTANASIVSLEADTLEDAHKHGWLWIETKQDTVVRGIGRLLKLCS